MNKSFTTRTLVIATLVTLIASVSACGGEKSSLQNKVMCEGKIATIFSLTGPSSSIGIDVTNGAKLAVEQFKTQNPTCTVELAENDSPQVIPGNAKEIAQNVASDEKVIGVIGASSKDAPVVNGILSDAGITIISPTAFNPELSEQGHTTFHRTLPDGRTQGKFSARYINSILKLKKVFVVDDEKVVFTKPVISTLKENISPSGTALFQTGQTDFSSIIAQIIDSGADGVFMGGYHTEAGLLISQLRAAGSTIPYLCNSAVSDPRYFGVAGAASEGTVVFLPLTPVSEIKGAFSNDYRTRFNAESSPAAVQGFDAANILLAGIKAGKNTRSSMEEFVDAYDGESLGGKIAFAPNGEINSELVSAWVLKAQGGKFVPDQRMFAGSS
ncbi:MAG: branched-chain amino acid ABC transporter substrate-binding protein [Longispora sp.]|nr:branched-chain amino acid ABC transporter substrate-binding protein [Longispora sp. (in: high G+C Gram-positive bacteria)]